MRESTLGHLLPCDMRDDWWVEGATGESSVGGPVGGKRTVAREDLTLVSSTGVVEVGVWEAPDSTRHVFRVGRGGVSLDVPHLRRQV